MTSKGTCMRRAALAAVALAFLLLAFAAYHYGSMAARMEKRLGEIWRGHFSRDVFAAVPAIEERLRGWAETKSVPEDEIEQWQAKLGRMAGVLNNEVSDIRQTYPGTAIRVARNFVDYLYGHRTGPWIQLNQLRGNPGGRLHPTAEQRNLFRTYADDFAELQEIIKEVFPSWQGREWGPTMRDESPRRFIRGHEKQWAELFSRLDAWAQAKLEERQ